ncbi:MAG: tRNA (adenosine(37)-N6)-threonylcarbamoyltransferase complex ATPase subunit type 1 TsaE [Planctomycetota bacterium]|jgi:tRNA threonylcarbamoyladenosine biosynthesis protein TsaE
MEQVVITKSETETHELGRRLAEKLPGPAVITLRGQLGAGKTQLVKGLLAGLGSAEQATSPTFALCHYYPGRVPLLHVDLYRLKYPSEIPDLGLDEALDDGFALAIEWPDGLEAHLPPVDLAIQLSADPSSPEVRRVELNSQTPLGDLLISGL